MCLFTLLFGHEVGVFVLGLALVVGINLIIVPIVAIVVLLASRRFLILITHMNMLQCYSVVL